MVINFFFCIFQALFFSIQNKMATYLPNIAYYVMSGTGIEIIVATIYAISTVKTAVSSAEYAYSWVKWAKEKRGSNTVPDNYEAWQWIDKEEDEFIIEKDLM